jgi:hypothetical protein
MKLIFPKYVFKGEIKEKQAETTLNLIMMLTNDKYPQGIDGAYRRIFSRITNKLDEAIEKDANLIELEQAELDLIKNVIREAKVKVTFVNLVVLLEDAIEAIENK